MSPIHENLLPKLSLGMGGFKASKHFPGVALIKPQSGPVLVKILPEDERFGSCQIHALNSDVSTQQHQETSPQSHTITCSPSFYLEDTSAYINFHSSTCCHGHVSLPALISHIPAPFSPQPSACVVCHRQPLSGHSHGSRAPNGNWNMELLPPKFPFSSPPFPSHHLAALPSNKSSSSAPCLGKLPLLTVLESPKRGSRACSREGSHNKAAEEAVTPERRIGSS